MYGRPRHIATATAFALLLAGCAGRDARPVALSQPQDNGMSCARIQAEVAGNNQRIVELNSEGNGKVAQNVAAGVAGLIIWPLWFAMDFKGAAGTDLAAMQARNQYLGTLAASECTKTAAVAP